MSNRDVNLVVKAKDQASKAVDAVNDALKALNSTQKSAASGAEKTSTGLSEFGAALAQLQKQIRSDSIGTRIEAEFAKARRGVERLDKSITESRESQTRYALEADKAARSVDKERQAVQRLTATLDRERAVLRELKKERTAANRPVARATTTGGVADPADVQKLKQVTDAIQEQESAVQGLKDKLTTQRQAARSVERESIKMADASIAAGQAVEKQTASLGDAQAEMLLLAKAAGKSEDALRDLGAAATRELRLAVGAQARIVQQAASQFRESQPGVAVAATEFKAAEKAANEYAAELGESASETKQARAEAARLEATFKALRGESAGLKAEFLQQQTTLGQLRNVSREAAGDLGQLEARQIKFTQAQRAGQQAVAETRAGTDRYRASLDKLATEAREAEARQQKLNTATRGSAGAFRSGAGGANSMREALRQFYGEGRRALSITQRLRGEVLSLATTYVGFFAAFQQVGEVVNAYMALEGAQSRLNAVFDGDQNAVAEELDFMRRNADRLGIEFGTLADQYTRFAAATKNTAIEDETRGIFLAVAEAARVNKLSGDQLNGTLNALAQISSKGAVQMEELRQQLGDRLPGAIQIMADGLGVGTEELIKMMEQGEVTSQALVNFAGELNNRFGGQLGSALETATTQFGRFQNAVFTAQLAFAEGGFLDALAELSATATDLLGSADFLAFLDDLSTAVAGIIKIVAVAVENFSTTLTVLVTLFALKLSPVVVAAVAGFMNFTRAIRGQATPTMGTFNKTLVLTTGAMKTTGSAAVGLIPRIKLLGVAFKGLLASTGIGLVFVALVTVFTALATRANAVEAALTNQRKTIDTLKDVYDKGARSIDDYSEALGNLNAVEATRNLRDLRKELNQTERDLDLLLQEKGNITDGFMASLSAVGAGFSQPIQDELEKIMKAFARGEISLQDFTNKMQAVGETNAFNDRELAKLEATVAKTLDYVGTLDQVRKAQALVTLSSNAATDAQREQALAVLQLGTASSQLGEGFVVGRREAQGFSAVITEISKGVPALSNEIKRLEELKNLKEVLEADGLPTTVAEITAEIQKLQLALTATQLLGGLFGADESIAAKIAELEKLADVVGKRIATINTPARTSRAAADPVKAAIERLQESVASDELKVVTDTLRAQGDDLGAAVREREAFIDDLFDGLKLSPAQATQVDALKESYVALGASFVQAENVAEAKKSLGELSDAVVSAQRELSSLQTGDATPEARLVQFRQEQTDFLEDIRKGTDLTLFTPEQMAEFDRLNALYVSATNAAYDLGEAERQLSDQRAQAEQATARVNTLLQTRRDLIEQLKVQTQQGDSAGLEASRNQIAEIDASLKGARQSAIGFWTALAGSSDDATAENARAQLASIGASMVEFQQRAAGTDVTMEDLGRTIGTNLASAFNGFAEAIANGENGFKALGDAIANFVSQTLIQIGQAIVQALIMQAVFTALGIPTGGGGGAPILSFLGGAQTPAAVNHSGRKGGQGSNRSRSVSADTFFGAPKFHSGKLGNGEMPAIIEKSEDVLTDDNPFHSKNLSKTVAGISGAGGAGMDLKIVNAFDPAETLEMAVSSRAGQKVLLNVVRANSKEFQAALDS